MSRARRQWATGTLLSAVNVTGVPLTDQRIVVFGAGSAGCGIASLIRQAMQDAGLKDKEAGKRFFLVDRDGLLVEGMDGIASFQEPFLQDKAATEGWTLDHPDKIGLLDVVRNAKPTALIGVSGQAGAFSEPVVRAMAEHNKTPGDLSVVEPDLARRGDTGGCRSLERRPCDHRHRQPISAADPRRGQVQGPIRPTIPISSRVSAWA